MLRGLWTLTWIEIKIFVREPLGLLGTVAVPVVIFVVLGRVLSGDLATASPDESALIGVAVPVFASLLMVLSAVVSIVAIISIYREGGILKRLRATPLRPQTILTAHVVVKLLLTVFTLALMVLAGRRFYPVDVDLPVASFVLALLFSTWSILSVGFLIASIVPTARFAQPIASIILYPMIAISGLFVPVEELPAAVQTVARVLPLTYAVSLLEGIWTGGAWSSHLGDVTALVAVFVICTALSAKVFRWE
jgi:ABC-2 type transport system permease protein